MRIRLRQRVYDWLDERSQPSRAREADAILLGNPIGLREKLITRAYFEVAAARWDQRGVDAGHFAAFSAGLERISACRRILDVGTGAGGSAALVAQRFPDARIVGIDLSSGMLRHAKRRHREPNLEFRRATVQSLPFDDGEFDLVTMNNAIPDLSELRRVARPEAEVLIANTFFDLSETEAWNDLWQRAGFSLVASAELNPGYWQIWRLPAAAESPVD